MRATFAVMALLVIDHELLAMVIEPVVAPEATEDESPVRWNATVVAATAVMSHVPSKSASLVPVMSTTILLPTLKLCPTGTVRVAVETPPTGADITRFVTTAVDGDDMVAEPDGETAVDPTFACAANVTYPVPPPVTTRSPSKAVSPIETVTRLPTLKLCDAI